ncbi:MAG: peptidylprolyl isomerase [Holophagaceae bacterium]|nr:peptidylprolyl isomerase [Holophagaceae bacterium]
MTIPRLLLPALLLVPPGLQAGDPALPAVEVREEVLVIVNAHIISRRHFQQAVEQENAALYRQFSGKELDEKLREAREKTLQGLIDAFLVQDKADDLGIRIPDDYLKSVIEDIKKQNNLPTDADLERALRGSAGIGLAEYTKRQKQGILQQEVLRREVFSKVAIEDQELRAYYEDHKDEYKVPSRLRIRELVIPKGGTPAEQQAAKAKVDLVRAEIAKGSSFEELVKQHSESLSRTTGGDLGWMDKGLLRPDLEKAAYGLKPGQVAGPLDSDKDTSFIQLIDAQIDGARPFAEVKDKILEKLQEPKAQNAIEQYMQGLRVRANVRFLVAKDKILEG